LANKYNELAKINKVVRYLLTFFYINRAFERASKLSIFSILTNEHVHVIIDTLVTFIGMKRYPKMGKLNSRNLFLAGSCRRHVANGL
jgi:hypothetical protein